MPFNKQNPLSSSVCVVCASNRAGADALLAPPRGVRRARGGGMRRASRPLCDEAAAASASQRQEGLEEGGEEDQVTTWATSRSRIT